MLSTSSRTKMKTINADSLTPILIFRRLQGKHKFLLESSAQHEGAGRFSFIGANPRKTYKGFGDEIQEYSYKTGNTYTHKGDLFVLLKRLMPRISNTTQFPFSGGAVGYVGHAATTTLSTSQDKVQLPDVHFHVYETVIVFDHVTDEVTLIHTNIDAEKKEPNLEELAEQLLKGREDEDTTCSYEAFESTTNEQFVTSLTSIKANLDEDITRVVLSKRFLAKFQGDSFALYRQLRKKDPAPYMYYVEFEDHIVLGTSPESLIRVKGERVIMTPTEGTFPRGSTKGEDLEYERKLYENTDIRKSHEALVSAVQQELQSVCFRDSIQVIEAMRIERSKHALHMTSRVEGQILPMLHALDVLAATLPSFASTGIPKDQAKDYLEKSSQTAGVFGGALGFIGFNGHLDFALTGKSIVIENETMHMQSTVTVTKYTNVKEVLKQVEKDEQEFLQLLEKEGGQH
ncbi:chorismate-binding protein [Lysinibacillus agricola]|uniref:Anthranilate synthase component 1 n=1 Tax=Lysinibacillus agricola TaxID=2590012 RepID=A0ABX7APP5_9BACI|nr:MULTISPECIES: chorismate-binding protein [Lysinibacillus]KOS60947.1 anthranilate synthase [Lysinibacillus sp. FJAT-14222]QQP11497.1 chorismate-binding protein [Lysinibacillus agricola]